VPVLFTERRELFQREISGERALRYVAAIVNHHRIQASPGFRAAAAYCVDVLRSSGLETRVLSFPADPAEHFWSQKSFLEWNCEQAELWLQGENRKRLCDYAACPISVLQRAASTPPEGIDAPVTVVDNPKQADESVRGKWVLTSGTPDAVRAAVMPLGAVGIVTDRMTLFPPVRGPHTLPDARQYLSFWLSEGEPSVPGFVLTPAQGQAIRERLAKGEQVRLWGRVRAELYKGSMEVVEGFLPGTMDEEVLLVAHLCHPAPSANDNASGAGTLLEVAKSMARLVGSGLLPRPKRGIRFWLVPEMTGTYAALAANPERPGKTVAALNLDMVGENQELCGSTLIVEHTRLSQPSFTGPLASSLLEDIAAEVPNLAGTGKYALFRYTSQPFSGGSDHQILADPSVGIPCPMVIQWPDRFYHTSADTLDKVDPEMLARVGVLSALYLNTIADAGMDTALDMARITYRYWRDEIARGARSKDQLGLRLWSAKKAVESAGRLVAEVDRESYIRQVHRFCVELEHEASMAVVDELSCADDEICQSDDFVPERVYPGPITLRGWQGGSEGQKWYKEHQAELAELPLPFYDWIDGTRSAREIARLLALETGTDKTDIVIPALRALADIGLVRIKPMGIA
jgi:hypothetical protein